MDIDTVVQEKIDNDTDFQTSLAELSDEDKNTAIQTKKSELVKSEFDSLSKTAKENETKFNDQKTRAEKAEKELKDKKPAGETNTQAPDISGKDVLVLSGAGVTNEEDIEEVLKASKLLGKSISDTLKDPMVRKILEDKAEVRKSANATNTNSNRSGPTKTSDAELLEKASKGYVPEVGSSEATQLFWARRGGKR